MIKKQQFSTCFFCSPCCHWQRKKCISFLFQVPRQVRICYFITTRSEGFFVCLPCLTSYFVVSRNLPTSFKSTSGWIVHGLKAKLKQHKKLTIVASTVLNFVSKTDVNIPQLMVWNHWVKLLVNNRGRTSDSCDAGVFFQNPQLSSQRKTFQFGSGHILMDVYIAHQGYKQGEKISR